tara:strand:+ start:93 stop:290 length:198 start_codon:yes stop_codon:yes gene_type:complete
MSIFSKQPSFCKTCGKRLDVNLCQWPGSSNVCSKECLAEYNWRRSLSIMGKEYKEKDGKKEGIAE